MFLVFIAITLANAKKEREITERQSSLLDSSSATLSAKQTEPTQAATLSSDTERTKAASSIVAAACAGSQIGVVPRGQIGEVGAFYWTVLAPDIVNLGREEQGSVSL